MKTARKIRKLVRDPNRFFFDFFAKRVAPQQRRGKTRHFARLSEELDYSVVTAVYLAEPYLDEFFRSLVDQTVGFKKRIELILVDDGSPDGSAALIEKWVQQYPENIRLVRKENGGQASARNAGMEFVRGKWVTFIDPDDWVSPEYFAYVDDFLARAESVVSAVCCHQIYYREAQGVFRNNHPLRDRFARVEQVVDLLDHPTHFNLQTANTFLRVSTIKAAGLRVDERCKPTFEDAKYFNQYLLAAGNYRVAFLSRPIYYYRKRAAQNSSVDKSWTRVDQFLDKFEHGYIPLLSEYQRVHGRVPAFIQAMVLYEMSWYIDRLIGRDDRVAFLTEEQSKTFDLYMETVFRFMDERVLDTYSRMRPMYRFGSYCRFVKAVPWPPEAYVQTRVADGCLLEVRFYREPGDDRTVSFKVGGWAVAPKYQKTIVRNFNRQPLLTECRAFIEVKKDSSPIELWLGSQQVPLQLGRRTYSDITLSQVRASAASGATPVLPPGHAALVRMANSMYAKRRYEKAWLFLDRDTQADDNAEHLYRWVVENTPEGERCFFLLRRDSHDWNRLDREGFRLIEFGSLEHKIALLNAEWVISSHADPYVHSYLSRTEFGPHLKYRFAFLQHGVIKDDLSSWLSSPHIEVFVTTTQSEYRSIVEGAYPYTEREVVRTGLPRHDRLVALSNRQRDLVVLMPTWRQYLLSAVTGRGNERQGIAAFGESAYFNSWQELISNEAMALEARKRGVEVAFFPHANMRPYLSHFRPAPGVQILGHADVTIQEMFARTAVLVTDFSSVAFEAAALRRPVVYFQFDRDAVMSDHLTRPGYFDYHRDGFGPVAESTGDAVAEVIRALERGCSMASPYQERADAAFDLLDGRCCERVYEELIKRSPRGESR